MKIVTVIKDAPESYENKLSKKLPKVFFTLEIVFLWRETFTLLLLHQALANFKTDKENSSRAGLLKLLISNLIELLR